MWLGLGLGLWLWARERERERGCGCVWGYVAVAVAAAVGEEDGERAAPVGRRGKAGRGNGTERTDSRLPRYSQPVRGYVRSICTGGIPSRGIAVSCFGSCMGGCGGLWAAGAARGYMHIRERIIVFILPTLVLASSMISAAGYPGR